jgi:predicted nucleotidyltransferase
MVSVSNSVLTSLAERIVQLAHPRQVILFGSQARGTARDGSDLDLLIVGDRSLEQPWSRRREIGRIRRGLPSAGLPIDI